MLPVSPLLTLASLLNWPALTGITRIKHTQLGLLTRYWGSVAVLRLANTLQDLGHWEMCEQTGVPPFPSHGHGAVDRRLKSFLDTSPTFHFQLAGKEMKTAVLNKYPRPLEGIIQHPLIPLPFVLPSQAALAPPAHAFAAGR